jgi:hypothetical protein
MPLSVTIGVLSFIALIFYIRRHYYLWKYINYIFYMGGI